MHTYEKAPRKQPPKFRQRWFVCRHMLVRIDFLGVGTDENKPCENKPRINDLTTRNNWNGSKRTR